MTNDDSDVLNRWRLSDNAWLRTAYMRCYHGASVRDAAVALAEAIAADNERLRAELVRVYENASVPIVMRAEDDPRRTVYGVPAPKVGK